MHAPPTSSRLPGTNKGGALRRLAIKILLGIVLAFGAYAGGQQLWAYHHYRAAARALERRDFDRAGAHLALCLEVWPNRAGVHFEAARTARRAGDYVEAERQLDRSEALGQAPEAIRLELGMLLAQGGELNDVEGYLQSRVKENHPDTPLILEALIAGYLKNYRLSQAMSCTDLLLQRQPDNFQAHAWLGAIQDKLQWPGAIESYRQALALDPDNDDVRLHLAEDLVAEGRAREAEEHLEGLRERQPGNGGVLLALARCRNAVGHPDEARQLLDLLLANDPRDIEALVERGKLALTAGKLSEAEDWLRRALALAPSDLDANYALYQCLLRAGKEPQARACLRKVEDGTAAERRLTELMGHMLSQPHDLALRHEAGTLFLRIGQDEEGLRWLNSVLREDPRYQATHQVLADYYERVGDAAQAARHRKAAGS